MSLLSFRLRLDTDTGVPKAEWDPGGPGQGPAPPGEGEVSEDDIGIPRTQEDDEALGKWWYRVGVSPQTWCLNVDMSKRRIALDDLEDEGYPMKPGASGRLSGSRQVEWATALSLHWDPPSAVLSLALGEVAIEECVYVFVLCVACNPDFAIVLRSTRVLFSSPTPRVFGVCVH